MTLISSLLNFINRKKLLNKKYDKLIDNNNENENENYENIIQKDFYEKRPKNGFHSVKLKHCSDNEYCYYSGNFKNYELNGKGYIKCYDDVIFEGIFNCDLFEKGIINYKFHHDIYNLCSYIGEYSNLMPNGLGVLYNDKIYYKGNFKNGCFFDNNSLLIIKENSSIYSITYSVYIGSFENNLLSGHGKYIKYKNFLNSTIDSIKYVIIEYNEGCFLNNKKNGTIYHNTSEFFCDPKYLDNFFKFNPNILQKSIFIDNNKVN